MEICMNNPNEQQEMIEEARQLNKPKDIDGEDHLEETKRRGCLEEG
jgi:hypothetical protein